MAFGSGRKVHNIRAGIKFGVKKRIFITGASGFVGKHVLRHIARQNVELTLVVRNADCAEYFQYPCIASVLITKNLFLETSEWWGDALKGIDTVIHLAWYAEPGIYLSSPNNLDCLMGTLNMAKGASYAGVTKFVGIGTCFEYEISTKHLSIDTPLGPKTLYAATKAATFLSLSRYFSDHNIAFAWCRIFYLFGEGEDERRLVAYVRSQIFNGKTANLSDGQQIRDYLDVSVAAEYIVRIALGDQIGAINICSGLPISVRRLVEEIANEYDALDLLNFGAVKRALLDPEYVVGIPNIKDKDK